MQKIELTNLEECCITTSNSDYILLKKYKWRYTGKGSILTNVKNSNGVWTSATINRILYPHKHYNRYLYKEGDILNVSKSNVYAYSQLNDKEEVKKKCKDLRKEKIKYLDKVFSDRLKNKRCDMYRGVTKTSNGKYLVLLTHKRKQVYFGIYNSAEEAAEVYNFNALRLFGSKAKLNVLGEAGKIILATERKI